MPVLRTPWGAAGAGWGAGRGTALQEDAVCLRLRVCGDEVETLPSGGGGGGALRTLGPEEEEEEAVEEEHDDDRGGGGGGGNCILV